MIRFNRILVYCFIASHIVLYYYYSITPLFLHKHIDLLSKSISSFFFWLLCLISGSFSCHKIINVYNQPYESGATFWPDVHRRVIIGLIISQILLMGLLSTRGANKSTLLLIAQPVLTIWFHRYCKGRFESAFVKFPLEVG
jgi:hypothetical protein